MASSKLWVIEARVSRGGQWFAYGGGAPYVFFHRDAAVAAASNMQSQIKTGEKHFRVAGYTRVSPAEKRQD